MSNVFVGRTYIWKARSGAVRSLHFLEEDPQEQKLRAEWRSTISRVPVVFELEGSYVKWTSHHNRWLFTLSGRAEVVVQDLREPFVRHACNSLTGFADGGSASSLPDTLHVSIAIARDLPGLGEVTTAWRNKPFRLEQVVASGAA